VVESGPTRDVIDRSAHPYTKGLIDSIPDLERDKNRLETIKGIVPNMFDLPKGCKFAPRCTRAKEICHVQEPEVINMSQSHQVACHFPFREEVL
ncbi:MAG: ABC transporter ATP-binding protein, partial [Synergistales bacterium]|nr:ABC transporter ATP-binding protein [Synergistales bacterium]